MSSGQYRFKHLEPYASHTLSLKHSWSQSLSCLLTCKRVCAFGKRRAGGATTTYSWRPEGVLKLGFLETRAKKPSESYECGKNQSKLEVNREVRTEGEWNPKRRCDWWRMKEEKSCLLQPPPPAGTISLCWALQTAPVTPGVCMAALISSSTKVGLNTCWSESQRRLAGCVCWPPALLKVSLCWKPSC